MLSDSFFLLFTGFLSFAFIKFIVSIRFFGVVFIYGDRATNIASVRGKKYRRGWRRNGVSWRWLRDEGFDERKEKKSPRHQFNQSVDWRFPRRDINANRNVRDAERSGAHKKIAPSRAMSSATRFLCRHRSISIRIVIWLKFICI